jgi:hypothetical protein
MEAQSVISFDDHLTIDEFIETNQVQKMSGADMCEMSDEDSEDDYAN